MKRVRLRDFDGDAMDEQFRFKFSLANLLLMMFPLAVVCSVIGFANLQRWSDGGIVLSAVVIGVMGVPAAIGALFGGRTGLWNGFGVGFRAVYITLVILIFLMLLVSVR